MARQVERANNLARLLDVTASFNRDGETAQPWEAVLALYSDEGRYKEHYDTITAENVLYFYILDERNPNSLSSNISFARENARALRPLLSTELWAQLNVFHSALRDVKRIHLRDEKISDFCAWVKQACQTHLGLVSETMFRDEAWYFYSIGNMLERADQTTRLVDVKYHLLLPRSVNVGSQIDVSQWNAVLRSAAGFQAYRRVHHRGLTGEKVSGFLLLDQRLPRSVAYTTGQAHFYLERLIKAYRLRTGKIALGLAKELADQTSKTNIKAVISGGMHEWIDDVQGDIMAITRALSTAFFGMEADDEETAK